MQLSNHSSAVNNPVSLLASAAVRAPTRPEAVTTSSLPVLRRHTQTQYHSGHQKQPLLWVMRPAGHQICLSQVQRSRSALRAIVADTGRGNAQPKVVMAKVQSHGIRKQYLQIRARHAQENTIGHISAKRASPGEPQDSVCCAEKTTIGTKRANCTTQLSTGPNPKFRAVLAVPKVHNEVR